MKTNLFYYDTINLAFLPKGVYAVKLIGEKGISTAKITKSK